MIKDDGNTMGSASNSPVLKPPSGSWANADDEDRDEFKDDDSPDTVDVV